MTAAAVGATAATAAAASVSTSSTSTCSATRRTTPATASAAPAAAATAVLVEASPAESSQRCQLVTYSWRRRSLGGVVNRSHPSQLVIEPLAAETVRVGSAA